ncbi:MAG: winged helix DNA-binding domain-containing protein [Acidimicrobiia bacterium]
MRKVDVTERRARLGLRHRLANPASDPVEATRSMVGLHSSDPVTVFLSARARVPGFAVADMERALYTDRSLIRFFGMRRTLWVIERQLVPEVHHSSTRVIAERERRRTAKLLEDGGVTEDGAAWLAEALPETLSQIEAHGEILTRDLTKLLPRLDGDIIFRNRAGRVMGKSGLASRAVLQLAMESKVIRTRPAGTWVSGQYRWAETRAWLGAPIPELTPGQAAAGLLRRWLYAFGPATETDIRWWTGWNMSQVRSALTDIGVVDVQLDGGSGYLNPDDIEPVGAEGLWVALLPSLDPTVMGWKERDWYLGRHGEVLFDRNGNAGPTVWVDGRVVGGWAQRSDGTIAYELFEEVDAGASELIAAEATRLQDWMGDVRVPPRFRSPHYAELASRVGS